LLIKKCGIENIENKKCGIENIENKKCGFNIILI
jgi:hypothetical protein